MHSGFVQIGSFDVKKFDRAHALAEFWRKNLREILQKKVIDKQNENFSSYLKNGGDLSYLELKKLNTVSKK